MLSDEISKYRVIALIYDTYHIVPFLEPVPGHLLSVEGVEGLVKENLIPRNVATIIYKIMIA